MIATLEKEMNDLEYVEFDSIVNENITYQKNNVKNYKDYKKYICKFDYIYNKREEFINEFIKDMCRDMKIGFIVVEQSE